MRRLATPRIAILCLVRVGANIGFVRMRSISSVENRVTSWYRIWCELGYEFSA